MSPYVEGLVVEAKDARDAVEERGVGFSIACNKVAFFVLIGDLVYSDRVGVGIVRQWVLWVL